MILYFFSFALDQWFICLQNLQQSRSFGSSFKFPEGGAPDGSSNSAPSRGNAAFGDDAQDDDLYA
jgi:transitional endoplasmic reticulum ATPase